jgi:hypothetical protein
MLFSRYSRHALPFSATLIVISLLEGEHCPALAQGKLEARYTVTLAGVPIGRGSWVVDIGEDQFSATANGATAGLLRVFASGEGRSAVRGAVAAGQLVPSIYTSSIHTGQENYEVRLVFSGAVFFAPRSGPKRVLRVIYGS